MIIKRWNGSAFVEEYAKTGVSNIVASGTPSSSNFLRGDGSWNGPTAANITDGTTLGRNILKIANPSAITFLRVNADNTISSLNQSDFRTAIGLGDLATKNVAYRSIKNFTSVALNGTTEVSCALTEDPRGKKIGIVWAYIYMGTQHRHINWFEMQNTTMATTAVLAGGHSVSSTNTSYYYFQFYLKSSDNTLYCKNAYQQMQHQATSSADTVSSLGTGYVYIYDVITLD
jgi:hypothetical protein